MAFKQQDVKPNITDLKIKLFILRASAFFDFLK